MFDTGVEVPKKTPEGQTTKKATGPTQAQRGDQKPERRRGETVGTQNQHQPTSLRATHARNHKTKKKEGSRQTKAFSDCGTRLKSFYQLASGVLFQRPTSPLCQTDACGLHSPFSACTTCLIGAYVYAVRLDIRCRGLVLTLSKRTPDPSA